MDFDLNADERALQQGTRDLLRGRFPMTRVRGGFDRAMFDELAAAGVFTMRSRDGLGMTESVLVFEELGRACVPGPLIGSHLVGDPSRIVAIADAGLVEHLDAADAVIVFDGEDVRVVEAAHVEATPVARPLDPLTPVHRISAIAWGEHVDVDPMHAMTLAAAQLVGIASALTDLAVEYAKHREQFGRPIGGFQAVKHICADMLVRAEIARAAVYAAGVSLDGRGTGDPATAVHAAKLLASDAGVANGKACVQVHGGMGFTWEVDAHLYLKRAVWLSAILGSPDAHAEAMAGFL